jgi:ribosomal protein L40E
MFIKILSYHLYLSLQVVSFHDIFQTKLCTRCDNLIPGMATACRWGVESGKLMYPSMFRHVPTCIYMSHRPNEVIRSQAAEEIVHVRGILLAEK